MERDFPGQSAEATSEALEREARSLETPPVAFSGETSGEQPRGMFGLRLVSVGSSARRSEDELTERGRVTLSSLVEGLSPASQLQLLFTPPHTRRGGEPAGCYLLVSARGEDQPAIRAELTHAWAALRFNLETFAAEHRFVPVEDPSAVAASSVAGRRWPVEPASFEVCTGSGSELGFRPPGQALAPSHLAEVTPLPKGAVTGLDRVVRALARQTQSTALLVTAVTVRLRDEELRALKTLLGHLARTSHQRRPSWRDEEIVAGIREAVEAWLALGTGYRLSCAIVTPHQPPHALITLLRRDFFGECGREGEEREPRSHATPRGIGGRLDLRGCYPLHAVHIPAFPSSDALSAIGIPVVKGARRVSLPQTGLLLGVARSTLTAEEVRLAPQDRLLHCYVCGATGTGKSTLLRSLALQDIRAGHGVCVVDPHGDLYQDLLSSIPTCRREEVLIIDASDPEYAVGINYLDCDGPDRAMRMTFVTNELIKIFDRLYDLRLTGGPMFETYMRNALLLLMDNDDPEPPTLLDLPLVFEDREFRKSLIERCRDLVVRQFWTNQAELAHGEASLANMAPYVTSKLNQFTTNSILRGIVGQARSTVDLREAMDRGRIVLVNLAVGLLGELDLQLLGMLIIGKLFSAAFARAAAPPSERRPFFVFIDEFHHFTTDMIAHLLAGVRKYGVGLTLANQTLSQLEGRDDRRGLLGAVLGNCGTLVAFRVGAPDAAKLEPYMKPTLTAVDLQSLPDYHAAVRFPPRSGNWEPFVLKTIRVPRPQSVERPEVLVGLSRERYGRLRCDVETAVRRRRLKEEGCQAT